jgi:predicted transcriptional regulator
MDEQVQSPINEMIELTSEIVASYVSNNTVAPADLPALIGAVQHALLTAGAAGAEPPREELTPAVPLRRSVTPDAIICLEDGKRFRSLKRHLTTHHGMTPQQYRERWNLPHDYPMVAPNYAAARSELARKMGLGQKRKAATAAKAKPSPRRKAAGEGQAAPKPRRRTRKAQG